MNQHVFQELTGPERKVYRLTGLEFGVGVGADFTIQIDFFVLRGGPFHVRCSQMMCSDNPMIAPEKEMKSEKRNNRSRKLGPHPANR